MIRPLRFRWLLAALVLFLGAAVSRADTLYWLGSKLPNGPTYADGGGDPFLFYVDETQSTPGGIPVDRMEREVRDAYQRWQDVPCAFIGARFAGAITSAGNLGTHQDSKNVMGTFVDSRDDERYKTELGNGVAVGVALTYSTNGVIHGCDTEFNHADYRFDDSLPITLMDFPSVINHETGHCLGLDHDPNDLDSVMYPTVHYGENRRTLAPHDVDNICQLYPETGGLGAPCSGSSCTGGLSCIDSPSGGKVCSRGCTPTDAMGCGAGFGCKASTAFPGYGGACFPGNGDYSQKIGAACADASTCGASNTLCFTQVQNGFPGGYCSQICDDGICPNGDLCLQGSDSHRYCFSPCNTQSPSCRTDYACNAVEASGRGYCFPDCRKSGCAGGWECGCDGVCNLQTSGAGIGSACSSNNDCATGAFCIPASSGWTGGYCTSMCGAGQNTCRVCNVGSACVTDGAEGQSFCLQTCAVPSDCRSGYTCALKQGAGGQAQAVCQPVPACTGPSDCPAGLICSGGACVDGSGDGGTCALCGDGGTVVSTSGGTTGGQPPAKPAGCGCGASPDASFTGMGLLLLAAAARAGRRKAS